MKHLDQDLAFDYVMAAVVGLLAGSLLMAPCVGAVYGFLAAIGLR